MKLLFDQNLSAKLCDLIHDLYPASSHVRLLGLSEADDRTVWDVARADGYMIVTQDADFAELAALLEVPPKIIWLRTGNQPTAAIAHLLRSHSSQLEEFLTDPDTACLEIYG